MLTELQDEIHLLVKNQGKLIITSSYILFPILTLLYFISDSLIIIILTEKWLGGGLDDKIIMFRKLPFT